MGEPKASSPSPFLNNTTLSLYSNMKIWQIATLSPCQWIQKSKFYQTWKEGNEGSWSNYFAQLLGKLQFPANATWPDIAFAVNPLSSYTTNPTIQHVVALRLVATTYIHYEILIVAVSHLDQLLRMKWNLFHFIPPWCLFHSFPHGIYFILSQHLFHSPTASILFVLTFMLFSYGIYVFYISKYGKCSYTKWKIVIK